MGDIKLSIKLKTAIQATKIGAEKALTYFNNNTDLKETLKEDNSCLTIADPETENKIKSFIHSQDPNTSILGEETGGQKSESFWIVDPIDGTRVYARGINTWAVLISYLENYKFQIGVAYFPLLNELYYAEIGKGAYFNDQLIYVSKNNPLSKSLINSGNSKNYKKLEIISDLVQSSAIIRGYETTYAHALVGAGKMDGSIDPYSKIWDFAPFAVIVPEAGGKITNMNGSPLTVEDLGIITSNGHIHDELVNIVNK